MPGQKISRSVERAAVAVDPDSLEREPLRKLRCRQLLRLRGPLQCLVPAALHVHASDRAGEKVGLPDAVADAARQLEPTIRHGEVLRPPVQRPQGRTEVVVGAECSCVKIVLERDRECAFNQDQRLPNPVPPQGQDGLGVQRLRECLRQVERLGERKRTLEMRGGFVEVAGKDQKAAKLGGSKPSGKSRRRRIP